MYIDIYISLIYHWYLPQIIVENSRLQKKLQAQKSAALVEVSKLNEAQNHGHPPWIHEIHGFCWENLHQKPWDFFLPFNMGGVSEFQVSKIS